MPTDRRFFITGLVSLMLTAPALSAPRAPRPPRPPRTSAPKIPQAAMQSAAVQASIRNGGHLYKHVGASREYIQGRVGSTNARLTFNAASLGADLRARTGKGPIQSGNGNSRLDRAVARLAKYRASPKQFSTFHSGRMTDAMYQQALRSKRTEIAAWMKGPKQTMTVPFAAGRAVGTVYSQPPGGPGRFVAATGGQFVLQKQGTNSFYPKTAKLT